MSDWRSYDLDPGVWTDITPTSHYNTALIINKGAATLSIRNPVHVDHVLTLDGYTERLLTEPRAFVYEPNRVAFQLKPASGTGPAVVIWT